MDGVLYKEAVSGVCINKIIRDRVDYQQVEEGESYLKLHNICAETGTVFVPPLEWKQSMRLYCHANEISYPYAQEEDISYNPAAAGGGATPPPPVPPPAAAPGAPYSGPPGGGYAPPPAPPAPYNPPSYPPKDPAAGGHVAPTPPAPAPHISPVLPPSADSLPSYGVPTGQPVGGTAKPQPEDDDEDADLMARLKNLQD